MTSETLVADRVRFVDSNKGVVRTVLLGSSTAAEIVKAWEEGTFKKASHVETGCYRGGRWVKVEAAS